MTDDRLLAETLQSPLDDMPTRQVNRGVISGVAFAGTWSEAEGWIAQNRMGASMSPVSGAGDPATLGITAHDGHDVMSYDSALDVWSVLAQREQADDG